MSPQQYLYNILSRPADYSILYTGCWHRNELARTDSVLAYGQPTGIARLALRAADVDT